MFLYFPEQSFPLLTINEVWPVVKILVHCQHCTETWGATRSRETTPNAKHVVHTLQRQQDHAKCTACHVHVCIDHWYWHTYVKLMHNTSYDNIDTTCMGNEHVYTLLHQRKTTRPRPRDHVEYKACRLHLTTTARPLQMHSMSCTHCIDHWYCRTYVKCTNTIWQYWHTRVWDIINIRH